MSSLASTAIAAPAPRALPISSLAKTQRHPIPALGIVAAIDVVMVRVALLFAGLAPQSLIFRQLAVRAQPLCDYAAGRRGNVDTDPLAIEQLSGDERRAATFQVGHL